LPSAELKDKPGSELPSAELKDKPGSELPSAELKDKPGSELPKAILIPAWKRLVHPAAETQAGVRQSRLGRGFGKPLSNAKYRAIISVHHKGVGVYEYQEKKSKAKALGS
jgi:hypothetical protein